jgi:hypothetical protein
MRTCVVAAALAALGVSQACGTSDSDSSGLADLDSGTAGSGGASTDSGPDVGSGGVGGDASDDGGGGAAGQANDKAFRAQPVSFLVHASPELFAFRACVEGATGFLTTYPYPSDPDHHLPETNYPGIAVGGVVTFDEVADLIPPETTYTVRLVRADHPSVVRARPSASKPVTCAQLFDVGGIDSLPDEDHADFPDQQSDDLLAFDIRVVLIDGCRADASFTETLCGTGYDSGQGNLRARVEGFSPAFDMEPSTSFLYPVQVSPALTALQQANKALELTHEDGTEKKVVTGDVESDLVSADFHEFTPPAELGDYGTETFTLTAKENAANDVDLLKASLSNIQRVSAPYDAPDAFFTGANGFLLMFVGDTSASTESWLLQDGTWNPAYDGRGLHALALRFQFEYRAANR